MKKINLLLLFAFVTGSIMSQNWQTIQSDDFNRADGPIGENYVVTKWPETGTIEIESNRVKLEPETEDLYVSIRTAMVASDLPIKLSMDFDVLTLPNESGCGYGISAVSENNYAFGGLVYLDSDSMHIVYMTPTMDIVNLSSGAIDVNHTYLHVLELTIDTNLISMNLIDSLGNSLYELSSAYQDTSVFDTISINTYQSAEETIYFDNLKLESKVIGIESNKKNQSSIMVYPNPSTAEIQISGISLSTFVSLYSITGQQVYKTFVSSPSQKIDISQLKRGIYMLKLQSEEGVFFTKVIKE